MPQREYGYYAFISYSRKDEKWAKWLQHSLETYRFPVALKKANASLPKKIFPIFRDKTDLTSGELHGQLDRQLEDSEFLLVVCSPNSAKSEWVNKEVSHFQEIGRNANIVPVIIGGTPHAEDSTQECYCPALYDENNEELLGVSVAELGKKGALLRVIASLMHLRYDDLVMRDRRRTLKRRTAACAAGVIAAAAAFGITWYNIPHSKYYWSVVYRNEIPEGLEKMSRSERQSADVSYKIVKQRGKVIRLETVNSADVPVEDIASLDSLSDYPVMKFTYSDGKGELSSISYYDAQGEIQLICSYEDIDTVDIIDPNDRSRLSTLPTEMFGDLSVNSQSEVREKGMEITRELLTHDKNGFLTEVRYMWDSRNIPACDSSGVYGMRYTVDKNGRTESMTCLDFNGDPLDTETATVCRLKRNSRGRVKSVEYFDAEGEPAYCEYKYSSYETSFDRKGRVAGLTYFGTDGERCCDDTGVSEIKYSYSKKGYMTGCEVYGTDGEPVYTVNEGIHCVKFSRDKNGRVRQMSFFDENGGPVCDLDGIASIKYKYDKKGIQTEERYYGTDGEPAYFRTGASGGNLNSQTWELGSFSEFHYGIGGNSAGVITEINGSITRYTYIDTDGSPMICRNGYASIEYKKNKDGLISRVSFYDENGKPLRAQYNAAGIEYEYDDSSRIVSEKYYDENGELCKNLFGAAESRIKYDSLGRPVKVSYYDTGGEPCWVKGGNGMFFSAVEMKRDAFGNVTSLKYSAPDGRLCSADGYYELENVYDDSGVLIEKRTKDIIGSLMDCNGYAVAKYERDSSGRITSLSFYDSTGAKCTSDVYRIEYEYDERGRIAEYTEIYAYEDGTEESVSRISEFDSRDNTISIEYRTGDGELVDYDGASAETYEYDNKGQLIRCGFYDKDMQPVTSAEYTYDEFWQRSSAEIYDMSDGGKKLIRRSESTYDRFGYLSDVRTYDSSGELTLTAEGYSGTMFEYDTVGNIVSLTYYGADGEPVVTINGYATAEHEYDSCGHIVRSVYRDENGGLITRSSGYPAEKLISYNEYGYITEQTQYDENGELFADVLTGEARTEYGYDVGGDLLYQRGYDENDELISTNIQCVFISEVQKGSPAEEAGLQADDVVLCLDGWEYFGYDSYENMSFMDVLYGIEHTGGRSITVCHIADGKLKFISADTDESLWGIVMSTFVLPLDVYDMIKTDFEDNA